MFTDDFRHNFDFFNVSKRLETIPPLGWDRGRSSIHILRSLYGVDWEDMVQVTTHWQYLVLHSVIISTFKVSKAPLSGDIRGGLGS